LEEERGERLRFQEGGHDLCLEKISLYKRKKGPATSGGGGTSFFRQKKEGRVSSPKSEGGERPGHQKVNPIKNKYSLTWVKGSEGEFPDMGNRRKERAMSVSAVIRGPALGPEEESPIHPRREGARWAMYGERPRWHV